MHRIDDEFAVSEQPTPGEAGLPGFFSEGDPTTGRPATAVSADWLNAVQESILAPIVAAGLQPSKAANTLLLQAIQLLAGALVTAHASAADPHTQYLTQARGDARYDATGAAAGAVAAHAGAADPHAQYLTQARGDARYDATGAAAGAVAAHAGAADPHAQYLTQARGDARYPLASSLQAAIDARILAKRPIGSVEIRYDDVDPGVIFGGTWLAFGAGRVLVGLDAADADFNAIGKTGGEKAHTLTLDEIPAHTHTLPLDSGGASENQSLMDSPNADEGTFGQQTGSAGGGLPHNNMPPFIVVKFWRRTA